MFEQEAFKHRHRHTYFSSQSLKGFANEYVRLYAPQIIHPVSLAFTSVVTKDPQQDSKELIRSFKTRAMKCLLTIAPKRGIGVIVEVPPYLMNVKNTPDIGGRGDFVNLVSTLGPRPDSNSNLDAQRGYFTYSAII